MKYEQHVKIFKNHLINLNRLNDKIKTEGLGDLILLKNLIENSLKDFSKKEIKSIEKDLQHNYKWSVIND